MTDTQAPNLVVLSKTWNDLRQVDFDIVWWADTYYREYLVALVVLVTPNIRIHGTQYMFESGKI